MKALALFAVMLVGAFLSCFAQGSSGQVSGWTPGTRVAVYMVRIAPNNGVETKEQFISRQLLLGSNADPELLGKIWDQGRESDGRDEALRAEVSDATAAQ
jgi:hypothetical protein